MSEKDLLLTQVQRGLNGYNRICGLLGTKASYDVLIAHETFCSGLAALYYANHLPISPLKILDIVEYPIFSQRSTTNIKKAGLHNPYADSLTYDFAVNVANKFDFCFSTSVGQADAYMRNGCVKAIELVMNCREDGGLPNTRTDVLSKMYDFDKSDILLVYPNRAYEHCGLEAAIHALAQLDERFKLVVLGEVVEELVEPVSDLVATLKLHDRFFVTGMLDPSMILPILSEADVALILLEPVVDNHRYSLPNRLFDAVATHTPIVTFDNTELGDFVKERQIGVVCGSTDPRDLSRSIKDAVERNIFFKDRLRHISTEYTWSSQVRKVAELTMARCRPNPRVLLIALKDIRRNDRVRRIAKSLQELNCKVEVISKSMPLNSMVVDGVTYHCSDR
jgi:glycosyltransferase involved in cell wall biosynthesis